MSRLVVTEADLARADRLLEAVEARSRSDLGKLFAEVREEALSCAMVRCERMFEVEERRQPRLPFGATPVRGTDGGRDG
jgi:hypothetical protein